MTRYGNHNRRKQLAEALILSKIDYALPVLSNANKMEINRINYYQLKLAHKAIYEKTFPNYLKLTFKNRNERLRKIKNDEFKMLTCKANTFHDSVSSIFNELPKNIRSEMKYNFFSKLIKKNLLNLALATNTSSL